MIINQFSFSAAVLSHSSQSLSPSSVCLQWLHMLSYLVSVEARRPAERVAAKLWPQLCCLGGHASWVMKASSWPELELDTKRRSVKRQDASCDCQPVAVDGDWEVWTHPNWWQVCKSLCAVQFCCLRLWYLPCTGLRPVLLPELSNEKKSLALFETVGHQTGADYRHHPISTHHHRHCGLFVLVDDSVNSCQQRTWQVTNTVWEGIFGMLNCCSSSSSKTLLWMQLFCRNEPWRLLLCLCNHLQNQSAASFPLATVNIGPKPVITCV